MSVKKYCYCENNCKYETLDKEEILAAITQAVREGTIGDVDTGFITTIKTINGKALKFFVGEQNEYAALSELQKSDLFALITNDTTKDGILRAIEELNSKLGTFAEKTSKEDLSISKKNPVYTLVDETYGQRADITLSNYGLKIMADSMNDTEERFGLIIDPNTDYVNAKIRLATKKLNGYYSYTDLYGDHYLPTASGRKKGGIKSGGDITVAEEGTVTVNKSKEAETAKSADQLKSIGSRYQLVNGKVNIYLEENCWYGISLEGNGKTFIICRSGTSGTSTMCKDSFFSYSGNTLTLYRMEANGSTYVDTDANLNILLYKFTG